MQRPSTAVMRMLVETIGSDSAWRLVERLGGTSLYVPWQPTDSLLSRVPAEDARTLCARLGGETIDIPLCLTASLADRNARIRAEADAGVSHGALARRYRTTERHIRRILARQPAPPSQKDLFNETAS
jgi:hypothetical protein